MIGSNAVWAIDGSRDVARINPSTGEVVAVVKGLAAQAIAASGNDVWVDDGETAVARINPRTNRVSTRISCSRPCATSWPRRRRVGRRCSGRTVWRISPGPPVVTRTITVGIGVLSLSFEPARYGRESVSSHVSRIDPATDAVQAVRVGARHRRSRWGAGRSDERQRGPDGPEEAGVQTLPASACGTVVGGGHIRFLTPL
jgi:hypothetical protein